MRKVKFSELSAVFWLSLVHHPLCDRYKHHVIQIGSKKICLGCTGLFLGFLSGIIGSFTGLFKGWNWKALALTAFIFYIPIMLHIAGIKIDKGKRAPRFLVKFLLGVGILIGILAILKSDFIVGFSMFVFGVFLYSLLAISRISAAQGRLEDCVGCEYEHLIQCPGWDPYNEYFPVYKSINEKK